MATRTIPTCSRRLGRGSCRNEATAMVNGEPRCFDHTPRESDKYDVMPIQAPEALDQCLCGCGQSVLKKGRLYRQGHDMRHRGALLRAFDGGDEQAGRKLVTKGWKTSAELQERRDKADAKAAVKAARASKKAEKLAAEADEPEAEPTAPRVSRGRRRRGEQQAIASA